MDTFIFSDSLRSHASFCYFTTASTAALDWQTAYMADPNTAAIFTHLSQPGTPPPWTSAKLATIDVGYRKGLWDGHTRILNGKLVLHKPIQMGDKKCITLIIVPTSLRRKIFSHFHAGPSGGHMGEYKTLFRLCLRFFWPGLRTDVKTWVKGCAQCISYHVWRTRKQELHFSWPVTIPFYIMHVDIWAPGNTPDAEGNPNYLFNSMCDLTQFVISSSITSSTKAKVLAKVFMEDVILSFGMVGVFEQLCTILKITL